MGKDIIVNTDNVKQLSDMFSKCLLEAKRLGMNWNLAEVSTAYFHTLDNVLRAVETQKTLEKNKTPSS